MGARAVEPLIAALKDSDKDARKAAADALGKIGDGRAVEPLITALNDSRVDAREAAADALVKIGTPAVEPLIELLKCAIGNNDNRVRIPVIFALVRIGEPVIEPLNRALSAVLKIRGESGFTAFADGGALTILANIAAKTKGAVTKN
jgi:HEAT repeat protein